MRSERALQKCFGLGIDLSDRLKQLPELRRLNILVARHWIGVNDVFSYRKESQ